MSTKAFTLYDTTLRDGTQGTGISFSVTDKIRVAEKLDAFGIDYIEGGWPGSNPKDIEFFREAKKQRWKHAKITAFGMTRAKNSPVAKRCASEDAARCGDAGGDDFWQKLVRCMWSTCCAFPRMRTGG